MEEYKVNCIYNSETQFALLVKQNKELEILNGILKHFTCDSTPIFREQISHQARDLTSFLKYIFLKT